MLKGVYVSMTISIMTINDYEDLRQLWIDTPGMGLNDRVKELDLFCLNMH